MPESLLAHAGNSRQPWLESQPEFPSITALHASEGLAASSAPRRGSQENRLCFFAVSGLPIWADRGISTLSGSRGQSLLMPDSTFKPRPLRGAA